MQDVINIEKYSLGKKRKALIVFDNMVVDMFSNKKRNPLVTELFRRCRKLNISIFLLHNHRSWLKYFFIILLDKIEKA